ncbi:hypothetical protein SKAU_G00386330 [Synaphobranchus kaupii]|uniref:Uncharacterized protein n=1 Tax=Synaphobranchus kaupii TaxID=118154 RepID=A0A9Q1EEN9_SYNKA|nr:hypothetical protein SKAU_G00386330 [Synaphobranchus kaupii]
MHESAMSASQNSCDTSYPVTVTFTSFFPLIAIFAPVTDVSGVAVGVHAPGSWGPPVLWSTPGRTREMVHQGSAGLPVQLTVEAVVLASAEVAGIFATGAGKVRLGLGTGVCT